MNDREKRKQELRSSGDDNIIFTYMEKCQEGGIGQSPPPGMHIEDMIEEILDVEFGPPESP